MLTRCSPKTRRGSSACHDDLSCIWLRTKLWCRHAKHSHAEQKRHSVCKLLNERTHTPSLACALFGDVLLECDMDRGRWWGNISVTVISCFLISTLSLNIAGSSGWDTLHHRHSFVRLNENHPRFVFHESHAVDRYSLPCALRHRAARKKMSPINGVGWWDPIVNCPTWCNYVLIKNHLVDSCVSKLKRLVQRHSQQKKGSCF